MLFVELQIVTKTVRFDMFRAGDLSISYLTK